VLSLQGISKQYGSKVLFEGLNGQLTSHSRLGLIGPNGAGKSTLIRMILGQESPDSGQVTRARSTTIGHLAQEVPKFSERSVLDEVMRLDGSRELFLKEKAQLESELERTPESSGAMERYGEILEHLELLDEYRLESRAKAILGGIGFRPQDLERPLTSFSGGWLMRVALARILLQRPDLLILDEPTNHLDLESLLWLEDFLKSARGGLLLVSHDRRFMNALITDVWEIENRQIAVYSGNLDAYVLQKEERLKVIRAQAANQEARIADLERFIERFGAKATKARQAQSRAKELEKIEAQRIELPQDRATVRFRFPPAPRSGNQVLSLKQVSLTFGERRVLEGLNFTLTRGERLAIVGPNGVGKTTLLKLLAGSLRPSSGQVVPGAEVKTGYYAQIQAETLGLNNTIVRELEQVAPDMPISQVRAVAGAFLFSGDAVDKRCAILSGGEKARVALAKLLLQPSNLLLLDEPTNHLDADSRAVLLEALQDFDGTMILVSHDRDFMSGLVDKVLEIVPDSNGIKGSNVIPLIESYDEYITRKAREIREKSTQPSLSGAPGASTGTGLKSGGADLAASGVPTKASGGISNNKRLAMEKERTQIEDEITRIEVRQGELGKLLSDEKIYEDKSKAMTLIEEQRKIEEILASRMNRWEELGSILEGLS